MGAVVLLALASLPHSVFVALNFVWASVPASPDASRTIVQIVAPPPIARLMSLFSSAWAAAAIGALLAGSIASVWAPRPPSFRLSP